MVNDEILTLSKECYFFIKQLEEYPLFPERKIKAVKKHVKELIQDVQNIDTDYFSDSYPELTSEERDKKFVNKYKELRNYMKVTLYDALDRYGKRQNENIMKQSEFNLLIKECYSELLKEEVEKPKLIQSQIGVFNSDGTVEAIKLLDTGNPVQIKHLLKKYYPTQRMVQSLLDYGSIVKLDKNVGETVFCLRDKKIRNCGNKLKGDFKSFIALVKKSGAQYVFLFDLKNKQWNYAALSELPYFSII